MGGMIVDVEGQGHGIGVTAVMAGGVARGPLHHCTTGPFGHQRRVRRSRAERIDRLPPIAASRFVGLGRLAGTGRLVAQLPSLVLLRARTIEGRTNRPGNRVARTTGGTLTLHG